MKIVKDGKPEAVITLKQLREKLTDKSVRGILAWFNDDAVYILHATHYTSIPENRNYKFISIDYPNYGNNLVGEYTINEVMEKVKSNIDEMQWFRTIGAFAKAVVRLKIGDTSVYFDKIEKILRRSNNKAELERLLSLLDELKMTIGR